MSGCYSTFPPKLLDNMGVSDANIANMTTKINNTVSYYQSIAPKESLQDIFAETKKCTYNSLKESEESVQKELDQFIIGSIVIIIVGTIITIMMYRYVEEWPLYVAAIIGIIILLLWLMYKLLASDVENIKNETEKSLRTCYSRSRTALRTFEDRQSIAINNSLCYYAGKDPSQGNCAVEFGLQVCSDMGGGLLCVIDLGKATSAYEANVPSVEPIENASTVFYDCTLNAIQEKASTTSTTLAEALIAAVVITIIIAIFMSYAVGYEQGGIYEAIILAVIYITLLTIIYMRLSFDDKSSTNKFIKDLQVCVPPFISELEKYVDLQENAINTALCSV